MTGDRKPDLTVLLDIPVGDGFARKTGQAPDRFERETKSLSPEGKKRLPSPSCRRTAALAGYRCQTIKRKN